MLKKLDFYGIRGVANDWFKNYLIEREQFLSINGENSTKKSSNVHNIHNAQIFIIDLPKATNFLSLLFADDKTFYLSHHDINQMFC